MGLLLMAACGGPKPVALTPAASLPAPAPTSVAAITAPTGAPPGVAAGSPAILGANLILNGGADQPFADAYCSVSDWQQNIELVGTRYGSEPAGPTADSPGPQDRGPCYFLMDVGGSASVDPTTQVIDVRALGTQIDGGGVTATLAGWFGGGIGAHYDYNVRFLDASGGLIDVLSAQAVDLPADLKALAQSTATMAVPVDTRSLDVDFTLDYDGDCSTCSSVAYADSLSLVLGGR